MSKKNNIIGNYTHFDKIILRTPLLPFKLETLPENEEEIIKIYNRKIIKDAVMIASPVLHEQIERLCENKIKDEKEKSKICRSAYKYYTRLISRCTPFGLFAGCSIVKTGNYTNIILKSQDDYKAHARFDMQYLSSLYEYLTQLESVRKVVKYLPNTTIYSNGDQIKYIKRFNEDKDEPYRIMSVPRTPLLDSILKMAKGTGITYDCIINKISEHYPNDSLALNFVEELISSQILLSEIQPEITGEEEPLIRIINLLKKIDDPLTIKAGETIESILTLFQETQKNEINKNVHFLNQIKKMIPILEVKYDISRLFQVDMYKPTESGLIDKTIIKDIQKAIEILSIINTQQKKSTLQIFNNLFLERYGNQRVPLFLALDFEWGIGYPPQNTHIVANNLHGEIQEEDNIVWTKKDSILFKKYLKAISDQQYEVIIAEEDINEFSSIDTKDTNEFPATFSVLISIHSSDTKNYANLIRLRSCGGSSATNMLGRFCYLDNKIHALAQEIVEVEDKIHKPALVSEIVHIPIFRVGNVLQRPPLRKYEIPFMGKPSVKEDKQILLDELFIASENGEIKLYRGNQGNEIIPKHSTAHNYSQSPLSIYRFLSDLQTPSQDWLYFSWGALQRLYNFSPRVMYKNIILSPAKWVVRYADLKNIYANNKFDERMHKLNIWREAQKMPQLVCFSDGDNELLIDMKNNLAIDVFLDILKKQDSIELSEFLNNDNSVTSDEGSFRNEFLISFYRKNNRETDWQLKSTEYFFTSNVRRKFSLYDEWIYFKIYADPKTIDLLLIGPIKRVLDKLLKDSKIEKWFFIRYIDNGYHLRLRLHLREIVFFEEIVKELDSILKDPKWENRITNIQIDNYEREIERYGGELIIQSENIFFYDSVTITDILTLLINEEHEVYWQIAMRNVDAILDDFSFSHKDKRRIIDDLYSSFLKENKEPKEIKIYIDRYYREHKKEIINIMSKNLDYSNKFLSAFSSIKRRTAHTKIFIDHIKTLETKTSINGIIISHIHMSLNRLFANDSRLNETHVYGFLLKYYEYKLNNS